MKIRYLTILSSCCLFALLAGCDNNKKDSSTSYNNGSGMTTSSVKPVGVDEIGGDETRGNLSSTDRYHTTSESDVKKTESTTHSTASGTGTDAGTQGKTGGHNIKNELFDRDGDGTLFNTSKRKKQRSPESTSGTTTGSSEDLEETTSDRSTH